MHVRVDGNGAARSSFEAGLEAVEQLQNRVKQILPAVLVVCAFCDLATDTAVGVSTLHKPSRRGFGVAMLSVVAACQIISTMVVTLRHTGGKAVLPLWLTVVATLLGLGQGVMLFVSSSNALDDRSSLVRA
jgi:hypothetical protein